MKSRAVDYLLDKLAAKRRLRSLVRRRSGRAVPQLPVEALLPGQGESTSDEEARGVLQLSPDSFAALLSPISRTTLALLLEECAGGWKWNADRMNAEAVLALDSAIYKLGLDEGLLALADSYLGRPGLFLGPLLKRELADGSDAATRRWHTDVEDENVLRILIYLSMVYERSGPFEYIPSSVTKKMKLMTGYRTGYVSDDDPRYRLVADDSHACLGPPGTAIIFDGALVLHRAKPPVTRERMSLTLTYTSRHPLQIFRETRLGAGSRARLRALLPSKDMRRIPAGRWL